MEDGARGGHLPSEWAKRGRGTPAGLHILFPPTSGGGTYHRLHLPKGGPLFSLPRVRLEGASGVDRFEMRSWIDLGFRSPPNTQPSWLPAQVGEGERTHFLKLLSENNPAGTTQEQDVPESVGPSWC